jgi:hypothetical protein
MKIIGERAREKKTVSGKKLFSPETLLIGD